MPRRAHDYNQTVIGDCGHVCQAWPLVGHSLTPSKRNIVEVVCDTCTREKYGIPDDENLSVWVKVKETEKDPWGLKEADTKPPARKRASKTATKKEPSIWAQLVMELPNGEA